MPVDAHKFVGLDHRRQEDDENADPKSKEAGENIEECN